MSGAVDGFTPNMSPEQVAELDRRRSLGDTGDKKDPDIIVDKRPWLQPDGTHKSREKSMNLAQSFTKLRKAMKVPDGGTPFGKPELPKREGESEEERQVRSHVEDEKDDPDKYPGGRKQAIAIGISEAKKSCDHDGCDGDCDHDHDADDKDVDKCMDKLKKFVISSAPPPGAPPMPKPKAGGMGGMGAPKKPGPPPIPHDAKSVDSDKDDDGDEDIADKLFGKAERNAASVRASQRTAGRRERAWNTAHMRTGKAMPESEADDVKLLEDLLEHEKKEMEEEKKGMPGMMPPAPPPSPAMSAPPAMGTPPAPMGAGSTMKAFNSRSIHIPAPLGQYDPYGVLRSAVTRPIEHVEAAPQFARPEETYKSCATHGLTYRSSLGCAPCNVQKSQECPTCGGGMSKSFGGVLRCPRGH